LKRKKQNQARTGRRKIWTHKRWIYESWGGGGRRQQITHRGDLRIGGIVASKGPSQRKRLQGSRDEWDKSGSSAKTLEAGVREGKKTNRAQKKEIERKKGPKNTIERVWVWLRSKKVTAKKEKILKVPEEKAVCRIGS